ncbi:MAG: 30S ribosomal protein S17 [Nitrospiraceae bacterium]|nr:30S ribosomal protein S17 [Nitrospiraceae bacterium]
MAKKELVGEVVSAHEKTIVVRVGRTLPHPLYLKRIKKSTKFYAHDEEMKAKVGDRVRIKETRPLSKLKKWRVVEILSGGERK